jgi:hypothetical protein
MTRGTISQLTQKVGGPEALGQVLRVSASTIKAWILRNTAPVEYHLLLWKIAVVHHVEWAPPDCDAFVLRSKILESYRANECAHRT